MNETDEAEYIPGTCNLGKAETVRRLRIGYTGLIIALIAIFFLEYFDAPRSYRLLIFPPVFYSISGFVQARHRFCYLYGFYGVFSVSGRKQFKRVKEDEALKKDRRTAMKILVMSVVGAVVITGIYFII